MAGEVLDVGPSLGVLPHPQRVRHGLVGPQQVPDPLVVDLQEGDLGAVGGPALLAGGHPREQGLAYPRYQALRLLPVGK